MTVDTTLSKTFAVMGAIVMVVAAIFFAGKLMVETGAPWYMLFGVMFFIGALVYGIGLHYKDAV